MVTETGEALTLKLGVAEEFLPPTNGWLAAVGRNRARECQT
jgi:hypothetical protein